MPWFMGETGPGTVVVNGWKEYVTFLAGRDDDRVFLFRRN